MTRQNVTPDEIARWQRQHDLTNERAAYLLNVGVNTYQQWKYGNNKPSPLLRPAMIGVTSLLGDIESLGGM